MRMARACVLSVLLAALSVSCTKAPTQPSVGGTGTADQFTLALDPGASVPYTFAVAQTTNVEVTLASVVDALGQVKKVTLAMAVGKVDADGVTCDPGRTVNTSPSLKAQIAQTLNPGSYCVLVTDTGALTDIGTATVVGRIIQNGPITSNAPATNTTETFSSNIAAGGSSSRTFYVRVPGTLSVTLQTLTPPSIVTLGVGIPGLNNEGCNLNTTVTTGPGPTPQITVPVDLSSYCVRVYDSGGLVTGSNGLASFTIQIVHP